jgi:serine/threonine-protein kinase
LIQVVGRYALYDVIGSGGMASVHLALLLGPVGFTRTVAVKRLHPQFATDPEFVSMFLDEARLAARIRHPNVVQTLDVVASDGGLFVVMELVQGETLSRLVRAVRARNERIPTKVVGAIVAGALHGLHAAHEARNARGEPLGLVHRDVSPENVLVGVDGVARVLDFGVAKAIGRVQQTESGQLKGKLAYMAPEQLLGKTSRAADIYAASVVLWEALTCRRLFDGEDQATVLSKLMARTMVPPSSATDGLSKEIDAVVMRGLAIDPAERYATAREMALAVERTIGVVTASEVGQWVENLANETLRDRLARVAAIENAEITSISSECLSLDEQPEQTISQRNPAHRGDAPAIRTSFSGAIAALDALRRHGRKAAVVAATVLAITLVGSLFLGLSRRNPSTADPPALRVVSTGEPAVGRGPAARPAPETNLPLADLAAGDNAPSESPPEAAVAAAESDIRRARSARAPRTTRTSNVGVQDRAPAHLVAATVVDDCSIPYTVDAAGIRHPRPECL